MISLQSSHSNRQIRQHFMVKKNQRHGRRSSRALRAKFWGSLVTGTSASGPLANEPITRSTRYKQNHVIGTRFPCTKDVSITSIQCTAKPPKTPFYEPQKWKNGKNKTQRTGLKCRIVRIKMEAFLNIFNILVIKKKIRDKRIHHITDPLTRSKAKRIYYSCDPQTFANTLHAT